MASLMRRIIPNVTRQIRIRPFANETKSEQQQSPVEQQPATNQQTLVLSDSCIKRLKDICGDGTFLRVVVEGGGCSGFQYKFELDSKLNKDDLCFGEGNAKVVIDTISLDYCAGSTLDYHTELIRSGFRIMANPKAEKGCSCGASFALKLD